MDFLDYTMMLNNALLGVVKSSLRQVANHGFKDGAHFFYISFQTGHKGVVVPDFLKAQYPDTLTVILQHEFSNLTVGEAEFSVNLSFNDKLYHIVVPFSSVVAFSDPSVNFSLQFQPFEDDTIVMEQAEQPELGIKNDTGDNIIPISTFLTQPTEPEPA